MQMRSLWLQGVANDVLLQKEFFKNFIWKKQKRTLLSLVLSLVSIKC